MKSAQQEWLLIFYSIPSHPVSSRMKIWRKLTKTGAVQLKGAVYVLPATEEHQELFQWLIGEVKSLGGDGTFVRCAGIETMSESEVRELFIRQIDKEYHCVDKALAGLEQKFQSIRKGTKLQDKGRLIDLAARLVKEFEDIRKRDFFSSSGGEAVAKRLQQIEAGLKRLGKAGQADIPTVIRKSTETYQNRIWITRTKPFVDRMASAWLIKRFIDKGAIFRFIEERDLNTIGPGTAAFDLRGAEFTHVGDLCTFEVLVKAFGIRDKSVKKIAEQVHDLDLKDDKYGNPGTTGVEEILAGIRKTGKNDGDILEKGMSVFEMLYQSKT